MSEQAGFRITRVREAEVPAIARLHFEFFGIAEREGHSLAKLGTAFLEKVFYPLSMDNPHIHVEVAWYHGGIVGFVVYVTNRNEVFRHIVRNHLWKLIFSAFRCVLVNPKNLVYLASNLRYAGGEHLAWLDDVDAHLLVIAVSEKYQSKDFKNETGVHAAEELYRSVEDGMRSKGCRSWYGATSVDNVPINRFLERLGSRLVGTHRAQGSQLNYWCKNLVYPQ